MIGFADDVYENLGTETVPCTVYVICCNDAVEYAIVNDMILRLEESQRKANLINEYKYWRKVFAAAAIQSGASCEDSVTIADEMLARLGINNLEDN